MVTIIKLESHKETLYGVAYDGHVILTASTEWRAQEIADVLAEVIQ